MNWQSLIVILEAHAFTLSLLGGLGAAVYSFWRRNVMLERKVSELHKRMNLLEEGRITKIEVQIEKFIDQQNVLLQEFSSVKQQVTSIEKSLGRIEEYLLKKK